MLPARPVAPSRVQLIQSSEVSLELCWGAVPTAEAYLLQIQQYDIEPGESDEQT